MLLAFKCRTQEELALRLLGRRIKITGLEADVYTADQLHLSSLEPMLSGQKPFRQTSGLAKRSLTTCALTQTLVSDSVVLSTGERIPSSNVSVKFDFRDSNLRLVNYHPIKNASEHCSNSLTATLPPQGLSLVQISIRIHFESMAAPPNADSAQGIIQRGFRSNRGIIYWFLIRSKLRRLNKAN